MATASNKDLMAIYRHANQIPETTVLATYDQWNRMGFVVKSGEKSHYQTDLWVPFKYKQKEGDQQTDEAGTDTKEKESVRYRLKLCYFFTAEQVEPMRRRMH